jgi:hypothetical protein
MKGFNHNVHYLENFDFDKRGELTNEQIPKNMLVLNILFICFLYIIGDLFFGFYCQFKCFFPK